MQIKDLLGFLTILLVVVGSFSTIFFILYRKDVENYETLGNTLKTIFLASLGDFSFDDHKSFSTILLIVYILLGNIILLNLLIAILSNTYTQID
jgi:hypothetical protein